MVLAVTALSRSCPAQMLPHPGPWNVMGKPVAAALGFCQPTLLGFQS